MGTNVQLDNYTQICYTKEQGREMRVPVLGPPESVYGGKITGTNDFADFPGKSIEQGGRKKEIENGYRDLFSQF